MSPPILKIAIACLFDEAGRVLLVRKRGSRFFMLPGGKGEPGETALCTLRRELEEELGLCMEERAFSALGFFEAPAANDPGHWVHADAFTAHLPQSVRALAELEELGWLDLQQPESHLLAPLLRDRILPCLQQAPQPGHDRFPSGSD